MYPIYNGDVVRVCYLFPDEGEKRIIKGVVDHVPNDSGDMWYIHAQGVTNAINPSCAYLVSIEKHDDDQVASPSASPSPEPPSRSYSPTPSPSPRRPRGDYDGDGDVDKDDLLKLAEILLDDEP